MFRGTAILREGDSALRLNFRHSQRSVRPRTRQDHADGAIPMFFRQRAHEMVDRHVETARFLARPQLQRVIRNGHRRVRRDDVDVVALHLHPIGHFFYAHRGFLGKQFSQQTVMFRVQVLHQHKRHARVRRQIGHQFRKGFNTAGGSADRRDQQIVFRGCGHRSFQFGGFG